MGISVLSVITTMRSNSRIFEIDNIITELAKYKDALEKDDIAYMEQLLKEGSDLKDEIDK